MVFSGKNDEAVELYHRALALKPDYPDALNNLGMVFTTRANFLRASPFTRKHWPCSRTIRTP